MKIQQTSDGSATLIHAGFKVPYHSVHGAVTESRHVFIQAGLDHLTAKRSGALTILEVGFGTGLNALLTYLRMSELGGDITYYGLEPHPLPPSLIASLAYPEYLGNPKLAETLDALHVQHAGLHRLSTTFRFHVLHSTLQKAELPADIDIVYQDAFAPTAQPEMWQPQALSKLRSSMRMGGVLVTYCAQGQFRRDLIACGFNVERIPGPPGKREMIRATAI